LSVPLTFHRSIRPERSPSTSTPVARISSARQSYSDASVSTRSDFFDEAFRGTEDRDLWFRIAERYEIAYIDEILALYRSSPGSVASDSGLAVQTKLSFARKHLERRACSRFSWLRALGQIYREQGRRLLLTRPTEAVPRLLHAFRVLQSVLTPRTCTCSRERVRSHGCEESFQKESREPQREQFK